MSNSFHYGGYCFFFVSTNAILHVPVHVLIMFFLPFCAYKIPSGCFYVIVIFCCFVVCVLSLSVC